MPSIAQSRTKVIVSEAIHIALYTPLYTAMRKDLFAKQGLEVELSTAGGIAVPVSVLLANRAQFALTGTGMSVNSTLEGGKMKVIAKVAGGVSLFAIAKPGLKINSLADLKGKTIATLRFPSNTISTPTYLMRSIGGFDPKEAGVNFLELPPGAQAAAVKDGRADLAIAFDWDASIGVTQFGLEVVFSFADILGPIAFSSIFVTEPYLKANGETVQKFTNALADAMKLLHTDPERLRGNQPAGIPQRRPRSRQARLQELHDHQERGAAQSDHHQGRLGRDHEARERRRHAEEDAALRGDGRHRHRHQGRGRFRPEELIAPTAGPLMP